MLKIAFVLVISAMVSCGRAQLVIPDQRVPHQVAEETCVKVWVRLPTGEMSPVTVRLLEGWWIAGPQVVEPNPP